MYADSGYVGERPKGFRRIRIMHGDIQGQVYSVLPKMSWKWSKMTVPIDRIAWNSYITYINQTEVVCK